MKKSAFYLFPVIVLLFCASLSAQETSQSASRNLVVARDFLRALYPELNNRHYFLTLESGLLYDSPADAENPFKFGMLLYLGAEPKGSNPPANFVRPCPPGTTQAHQTPSGGFIGSDCPPPAPYGYQFLLAAFHFDAAGYLESFNAQGDAAVDPLAKTAFAKAAASQRNLTGRDLAAELKRSGAKYGRDDKSAFVKDLPLAKLATFLGKTELISAELPIPDEDTNGLYADYPWVVKVKATRADNTTMIYRLEFEQFQGHLTALCELSSKAPCNIWRTPG